jgi:hypothetical protein
LILRGARLPGESRAPMAASLAALVGFDALLAPHALSLLEGLDAPALESVAPVLRAVAETTDDAGLRARLGALLGATWATRGPEDALVAAMGGPYAPDAVGADTPPAVRDALQAMYGAAAYGDDALRVLVAHRGLAALDAASLRRDLAPTLRARLADQDEDCRSAALRVIAGLADAPWSAEERADWAETLKGVGAKRTLRLERAEAMEAWGIAEPPRYSGVSPAVRRYLRQLGGALGTGP